MAFRNSQSTRLFWRKDKTTFVPVLVHRERDSVEGGVMELVAGCVNGRRRASLGTGGRAFVGLSCIGGRLLCG
jgi:hypothetical protein